MIRCLLYNAASLWQVWYSVLHIKLVLAGHLLQFLKRPLVTSRWFGRSQVYNSISSKTLLMSLRTLHSHRNHVVSHSTDRNVLPAEIFWLLLCTWQCDLLWAARDPCSFVEPLWKQPDRWPPGVLIRTLQCRMGEKEPAALPWKYFFCGAKKSQKRMHNDSSGNSVQPLCNDCAETASRTVLCKGNRETCRLSASLFGFVFFPLTSLMLLQRNKTVDLLSEARQVLRWDIHPGFLCLIFFYPSSLCCPGKSLEKM